MSPTRCTIISNSVVAMFGRGAPAPCERSSLDLPAAPSGVAGLSRDVSIKNATTFAVAAASEIISKSNSLVEA